MEIPWFIVSLWSHDFWSFQGVPLFMSRPVLWLYVLNHSVEAWLKNNWLSFAYFEFFLFIITFVGFSFITDYADFRNLRWNETHTAEGLSGLDKDCPSSSSLGAVRCGVSPVWESHKEGFDFQSFYQTNNSNRETISLGQMDQSEDVWPQCTVPDLAIQL